MIIEDRPTVSQIVGDPNDQSFVWSCDNKTLIIVTATSLKSTSPYIDHCCAKCDPIHLVSSTFLYLQCCEKDTVYQFIEDGDLAGIGCCLQGKMHGLQSMWSSIKRKQLLWNLHLEWNSWSHFFNVGISIKPRVILLISTPRATSPLLPWDEGIYLHT